MQSTVDDGHATLPPIEIPEHSLDNIYNGVIFPSLNPAKIFQFNSQ